MVAGVFDSQPKGSGVNPSPPVGILERDAVTPHLLLNDMYLNSL